MPSADSLAGLRNLFADLVARLNVALRFPARAVLYVSEGETVACITPLPGQELAFEFFDIKVPLSSYPQSVLDSVFRVCNPILCTHEQFSELGDVDVYVASQGVTSFICLPVRVDGQQRMAFWLERTQPDQDFSFAELDAVEALLDDLRQTSPWDDFTVSSLQQSVQSTTPINISPDESLVQDGVHAVETHLRMFERAVKASDFGFTIVDARLLDKPIIYCNPAFERITGYSFREVVGRNCRFLQRAGEDQEALSTLRDAMREAVPCQVLLRNYRKDGSLFWNELTVSPVKDTQGNVTHFIGMQSDVSARIEAEQRKQELESRFHALFDNSLDGIAYYSLEGCCISANRAYCEMLGYSQSEIVGICYEDITPAKWHDFESRIVGEQLFTRGCTDLYEKEYMRKDGTVFPISVRATIHYDADGNAIGMWGIVRDISEYKQALHQLRESEARMEFLAYHDVLTQLPNRLLFQDRVSKALERARRYQKKLAVLLLDLDRFKNINDSLGHAVGDQFLRAISTRLGSVVRDCDTAARIGGDEFVVVMEDFDDVASVTSVATKLLKVLAEPICIEHHELYSTASIGISIYPSDGDSVETLIKAADAAMYRAKEKGKNNFHYYTEDINRRTFELLLLENDLRRALDQNQFFVAYQPQFSLNGGMLVGVEALMRWQHPVQGLIAPTEFIPLAEETGLIVPLGRWMLRASCTQIRQWLDSGYRLGRIAVNLSARQFRQPGLVEDITQILSEVGLSPEHLELEITESIAMDNVETTIAKLEVLKSMGLQLSIDDFGTGYSSLSYLKRFAIDKLKIDKSFVRDIVSDPNDAAIAASTIALAHKMGLKVIAEGVETAEQVAFLREQGCDEVQGFFYGKPVPAREFERLLNMTPRRHRA